MELLSAVVALFSFVPGFPLTKERASRWAGILLFSLAGVVGIIAVLSLERSDHAEKSLVGLVVTIAALVVMPLLAWFKRRVARATGNRALAADAVQSATCAYLAVITLAGLALNVAFQIRWIDPVASLLAIPFLLIEGREAIRGESCNCC